MSFTVVFIQMEPAKNIFFQEVFDFFFRGVRLDFWFFSTPLLTSNECTSQHNCIYKRANACTTEIQYNTIHRPTNRRLNQTRCGGAVDWQRCCHGRRSNACCGKFDPAVLGGRPAATEQPANTSLRRSASQFRTCG